MVNTTENKCISVFSHNADEITEAFTELWTKIINEKEECAEKSVILQTRVSGL